MRLLATLSGCVLALVFTIGCRQETTQEHDASMPGDFKVKDSSKSGPRSSDWFPHLIQIREPNSTSLFHTRLRSSLK
jgi:hypothetical protein